METSTWVVLAVIVVVVAGFLYMKRKDDSAGSDVEVPSSDDSESRG